MAAGGPATKRILAVLFVLWLTVFGQISALATEHSQHYASGRCLQCHAGPLPFLHVVSTLTLAPAFAVRWMGARPDYQSAAEAPADPTSSRAPPA